MFPEDDDTPSCLVQFERDRWVALGLSSRALTPAENLEFLHLDTRMRVSAGLLTIYR